MHAAALVTLNMRELDRLKVIQAVVDMGLKPVLVLTIAASRVKETASAEFVVKRRNSDRKAENPAILHCCIDTTTE